MFSCVHAGLLCEEQEEQEESGGAQVSFPVSVLLLLGLVCISGSWFQLRVGPHGDRPDSTSRTLEMSAQIYGSAGVGGALRGA